MVSKGKKLKLLAAAAVAVVALPVAASAATTTMTATATFFLALTLSPTTLDFSKIDYGALPSSGSDYVRVGANGTVAYGGTFSAHTGAAPTNGSVTVTQGTASSLVDISCSTTGKLANSGGSSTIGIDNVEINTAAAAVAYGSNHACAGIGTNSITGYTLAGSDVFKVGGEITGATLTGAFAGGLYSTANTNGLALSVQVLYE